MTHICITGRFCYDFIFAKLVTLSPLVARQPHSDDKFPGIQEEICHNDLL